MEKFDTPSGKLWIRARYQVIWSVCFPSRETIMIYIYIVHPNKNPNISEFKYCLASRIHDIPATWENSVSASDLQGHGHFAFFEEIHYIYTQITA